MTPPTGRAGRWVAVLAVLLAGLTVGWLSWLAFGSGDARPGSSASPTSAISPGAPGRSSPPAPAVPGGPQAASTSPGDTPLAGLTVALDPGHNGANSTAPRQVGAPVPDGRGGSKACNTTGTSTDDGYPEHAFAWDVAARTAASLEALGARVVLTRPDDEGVGPCVDVRGAFAQEAGADVLVSVHANGTQDRSVRGFFVIVADPPPVVEQDPAAREANAAASHALAGDMVEALVAAGFAPSPLLPDGVSRRADLATLNLAERPAVLLELGEMRNAEEAAVMASDEGRQRYADAIAAGLVFWLAGRAG